MTKFLPALLLIALFSCGQSKEKKDSIAVKKDSIPGWKTFKGPDYSIQYPPNWTLSEPASNNSSFAVLAPVDSEQDVFRENVNVVSEDLGGRNVELADYAEASEKQITTAVTNGKIIESKRVKDGSDEYHKIIFTGDQAIYHLKFEQYYRIRNKKAYVLTFTAEQPSFNAYKEKSERLMNSFSINN